MQSYDIIIIGAGSIGVPLSFYLSQYAISVLVLEKMPSVGRGQNRSAIGGIRATHSDPAKIKICRKSIEIVSHMEDLYGYDIDWIAGGYLFVAYDYQTEEQLRTLLELQKHFELNIGWISSEEVTELVPGINPDKLLGGTYSPEDGSASPLKVIDAFYMLARQTGVRFHFNEEVTDFETRHDQIWTVKTNRNSYSAALIIDAAGASSGNLGKLMNIDVPVYPESHEAGITEPAQRFFEPMIVDTRPAKGSANYYFYQNASGQVVFCLTPEPGIPGTDCDNTSIFLPQITERMIELYPRLRNLRVRRTWRGLYPMTPDGLPIISYTQEYPNYLIVSGMCGQGFMIGPGLGKILSEMIVDNIKEYDDILRQLSLYRQFAIKEILK
jgi:sarcosine oxidase subunit beta